MGVTRACEGVRTLLGQPPPSQTLLGVLGGQVAQAGKQFQPELEPWEMEVMELIAQVIPKGALLALLARARALVKARGRSASVAPRRRHVRARVVLGRQRGLPQEVVLQCRQLC